jgi:hypothetical protein
MVNSCISVGSIFILLLFGGALNVPNPANIAIPWFMNLLRQTGLGNPYTKGRAVFQFLDGFILLCRNVVPDSLFFVRHEFASDEDLWAVINSKSNEGIKERRFNRKVVSYPRPDRESSAEDKA